MWVTGVQTCALPISRAISTLSKKDLDDIINDGEAIEVKCQFCNKAYHFEVDELKEMRK